MDEPRSDGTRTATPRRIAQFQVALKLQSTQMEDLERRLQEQAGYLRHLENRLRGLETVEALAVRNLSEFIAERDQWQAHYRTLGEHSSQIMEER